MLVELVVAVVALEVPVLDGAVVIVAVFEDLSLVFPVAVPPAVSDAVFSLSVVVAVVVCSAVVVLARHAEQSPVVFAKSLARLRSLGEASRSPPVHAALPSSETRQSNRSLSFGPSSTRGQ